jgi:hypothetical protein
MMLRGFSRFALKPRSRFVHLRQAHALPHRSWKGVHPVLTNHHTIKIYFYLTQRDDASFLLRTIGYPESSFFGGVSALFMRTTVSGENTAPSAFGNQML